MIAAGTVLAALAFTVFAKPSGSGRAAPTQPEASVAVATTPAVTATPSPTPTAKPAPTEPPDDNSFLIRNQASGRCVDLPLSGPADAGTVLFQWDCRAGDSENQETEKVRSGKDFLLRNVKSGLCLDLYGDGPAPAGSAVLLGKCATGNSDNQRFRSRTRPGGFQLIQTKSDLCLDLIADDPEGETGNGRNLVLSHCSSVVTQIWTFE